MNYDIKIIPEIKKKLCTSSRSSLMGLQKKRKIRDYETAANQRDARAHTKYGSAGHFLFHSFHRWLFPETKPTHRRCLSDFNCLVSMRVRKNVTTNSSTDCFFFVALHVVGVFHSYEAMSSIACWWALYPLVCLQRSQLYIALPKKKSASCETPARYT